MLPKLTWCTKTEDKAAKWSVNNSTPKVYAGRNSRNSTKVQMAGTVPRCIWPGQCHQSLRKRRWPDQCSSGSTDGELKENAGEGIAGRIAVEDSNMPWEVGSKGNPKYRVRSVIGLSNLELRKWKWPGQYQQSLRKCRKWPGQSQQSLSMCRNTKIAQPLQRDRVGCDSCWYKQ